MEKAIPAWAMKAAAPEDRDLARHAHRRDRMQIEWPNLKALRAWAKDHGWPAPRFGFKKAFIIKMLENDAAFVLALNESGIDVRIPKKDHTISVEEIRELDALYEERSEFGYPTSWGTLVEELREIRRAVQAGVVVKIEGTQTTLRSFQSFYDWAHGRYHMLEDGYDSWIGDDDS